MGRHSPRASKIKKLQYSKEQLQNALLAVQNGSTIYDASKSDQIPYSTLRDKVIGNSPQVKRASGYISVLGENIEKLLKEWLLSCANMGFAINQKMLLDVQKNKLKCPFKNNRPRKVW